jgi:hypothetical protein
VVALAQAQVAECEPAGGGGRVLEGGAFEGGAGLVELAEVGQGQGPFLVEEPRGQGIDGGGVLAQLGEALAGLVGVPPQAGERGPEARGRGVLGPEQVELLHGEVQRVHVAAL